MRFYDRTRVSNLYNQTSGDRVIFLGNSQAVPGYQRFQSQTDTPNVQIRYSLEEQDLFEIGTCTFNISNSTLLDFETIFISDSNLDFTIDTTVGQRRFFNNSTGLASTSLDTNNGFTLEANPMTHAVLTSVVVSADLSPIDNERRSIIQSLIYGD